MHPKFLLLLVRLLLLLLLLLLLHVLAGCHRGMLLFDSMEVGHTPIVLSRLRACASSWGPSDMPQRTWLLLLLLLLPLLGSLVCMAPTLRLVTRHCFRVRVALRVNRSRAGNSAVIVRG